MEKKIEKGFRKQCIDAGCKVVKYQDPGRTGGPDRLVLLPGGFGVAVWVELKDMGEVPRRDQLNYLIDLNKRGFVAYWADNIDAAMYPIKVLLHNAHSVDFMARVLLDIHTDQLGQM